MKTKDKKNREETENPAQEEPRENESITSEQKEQEPQESQETEMTPEQKENEKLKDALLRQAAEYDNYRKRTAKERLELEPEIIARIMTKLLPVLDNIERALAAECTDTNYKKGVEMISESFIGSLADLGVEEIKTDGESFDPNFHQAVQQVSDENLESGKIAQTFQKGYIIGDRVIRFSMVSVVS